jgi:hypothetical protein
VFGFSIRKLRKLVRNVLIENDENDFVADIYEKQWAGQGLPVVLWVRLRVEFRTLYSIQNSGKKDIDGWTHA